MHQCVVDQDALLKQDGTLTALYWLSPLARCHWPAPKHRPPQSSAPKAAPQKQPLPPPNNKAEQPQQPPQRRLTARVVVHARLGEHGVVLDLRAAHGGAVGAHDDELGCGWVRVLFGGVGAGEGEGVRDGRGAEARLDSCSTQPANLPASRTGILPQPRLRSGSTPAHQQTPNQTHPCRSASS